MIMIILKELNENVYQTFRNVTWQCQTKSLLFWHFWFLFWQTFFCYCLFWFAFTNAIILIAIHATFDWICRRIETREHKLWFRRVWPSYPFSPKAKSRSTMPCEGIWSVFERQTSEYWIKWNNWSTRMAFNLFQFEAHYWLFQGQKGHLIFKWFYRCSSYPL